MHRAGWSVSLRAEMEREAPLQKRQNPRTAALSVFSSLCSVASIAFCVFLSITTSDVTRRIVDLESRNGEPTLIRPVGYSEDDLNVLIRDRVDELLSQVSLVLYAVYFGNVALHACTTITVNGLLHG